VKPTRAQELAVLRSVIYASLFDYPLTLEQVCATLVEVRADEPTVAGWWRESEFLQAAIEHRDGLYFPAGRGDLVGTRTRREALSRDLLERDRRLLALVSGMPFVRMVAVSGSLAHLNAEAPADLDLFVITAPHRVWSVTLAVLVTARLLGWRKRMCLNYVISERALSIAPADLFSANQIIHLRPIVGHEVFAGFIDANPFVRVFYPNFQASAVSDQLSAVSHQLSAVSRQPSAVSRRPAIEQVLSLGIAPLFEKASRWIYRRHLARKSATWRSRDQVRLEPECLKLHTSSHRAETLQRFDAAVARAVARWITDSSCGLETPSPSEDTCALRF
jgi:hypothetical protein